MCFVTVSEFLPLQELRLAWGLFYYLFLFNIYLFLIYFEALHTLLAIEFVVITLWFST